MEQCPNNALRLEICSEKESAPPSHGGRFKLRPVGAKKVGRICYTDLTPISSVG